VFLAINSREHSISSMPVEEWHDSKA